MALPITTSAYNYTHHSKEKRHKFLLAVAEIDLYEVTRKHPYSVEYCAVYGAQESDYATFLSIESLFTWMQEGFGFSHEDLSFLHAVLENII